MLRWRESGAWEVRGVHSVIFGSFRIMIEIRSSRSSNRSENNALPIYILYVGYNFFFLLRTSSIVGDWRRRWLCAFCVRARVSICGNKKEKKKELSRGARALIIKRGASSFSPTSLLLVCLLFSPLAEIFLIFAFFFKIPGAQDWVSYTTVLEKKLCLSTHSHFHFNRGKKCLRWDTRKDCRVKKTSVGR